MKDNRSRGRFGQHGGQYIPETLMNAVIELEKAYDHYRKDPEFNRELTELFNNYAGRPSRLYFAKKMTEDRRRIKATSRKSAEYLMIRISDFKALLICDGPSSFIQCAFRLAPPRRVELLFSG